MIVRQAGSDIAERYVLCRTKDGRRGWHGEMASEDVRALIECGALVTVRPGGQRWVWNGAPRQDECEGAVRMPVLSAQKPSGPAKRKPLLERALTGVPEGHQRKRLAAAALRFLRDYERAGATGSVTMNWSFDLAGTRGVRAGLSGGLSELSLSANRTLDQVRAGVTQTEYKLLEGGVCQHVSGRRLGLDLGIPAQQLKARLCSALTKLAALYDLQIAAEPDRAS